MADQYKKPYLDSSVFIAWIKGEVEKGVKRKEIVEHILFLAEKGIYIVVTSALTLAEVHKRKGASKLAEKEDERILSYFEHEFIQIVDVDRETGEMANKLCREHASDKLMPNDAIHLASALRAKCDALLAWDEVLSKLKRSDIRCEEPIMIGQGKLDL